MSGKSLGEMYAELAIKSDKLQSGSKKSEAVLRKLNADIDSITDSINEKLASMGKTMSIGVTLPLTVLGATSLNTFKNFEQAMQNTFSVMSASAEEMELLRNTAEKMGAETRFSASQAASALYSLGSAGQNAQTAVKSLDGVLRLAGATGSDLESTSAMLSSTLSQFKLNADQSARVADVFSKAISKSQANMGKLAYSMRYVGPLAAGFSMSLEGTTAALMALYNAGYQGEQAGTIMRGGLTVLAKQTSKLDESLKAIGLTYEEVNPAANSFADIIGKLKKSGADTTKILEIFGSEAGAGMAALVEQGGEAIKTFETILQSSQGAAAEMQAIQNASTANAIDEMRSAWESVQITLTGNVQPAVNAVIETITKMLRTVEALPVGFQVAGSAALVFAAAAGPILLVATSVKKLKAEMVKLNVAMASNPFLMWGAIAAGAVAVIAGVVAQVKKAQEEHEKLSRQVLESAKGNMAKANDEMAKGKTIETLLGKYNSLKNVVNTSKEAQAEYNDVVKQLEALIPGVVTKTDEFGNALEINADKAREAAKKNLETARVEKEHALSKLKTSRMLAEAHKDEYENKLKSLKLDEDIRQKDLENAETKRNYFLELNQEWDRLKDKRKLYGKLTKEEMERTKELARELDIHGGESRAYKDAELAWRQSVRLLDETKTKLEKIDSKYGDHIKTLEEVALLEEEIKNIGQQQKALAEKKADPLKTQKQYLDEYLEQKRQFDEEITGKKAYAKKTGGQYDAVTAEIQFLDEQLKKLLEIKPGEIDKVFTLDDKGTIEDITKRLQLLYAEQERLKNAKDKKDKTWGEQLSELDDYWQSRLSSAEAYGEDELALTAQYQQKRMELLEEFRKWAIGSGDYTDDSSLNIVLGGFQTIGKEIIRTSRLSRGELEAFLDEWNSLTSELAKKQAELATLSVYDPESFSGSVEAWEAYKKEVQARVKEIQESLGQLKDDQNENPLKEAFEKEIDLGNISGARKALIPYLKSLKDEQAANEKNKELWEEKQEEIDEATRKVDELVNALASKISTLGGAFTDIGQEVANIITTAITEGSVNGFQALKGMANVASGIGQAIGDPVTMAIAGVASGVFEIFDTIYTAINQKSLEEIDTFNQGVAEGLAEWRSQVAANTEGAVEALARVMSGGQIDAASMFDSLVDSMNANRVNEFVNSLGNVKTTIQGLYEEQADASEWYNPFTWGTKKTVMKSFDLSIAELMDYYREAYNSGTNVLIGGIEYSATQLYEAITGAIQSASEEAGIDSVVLISDYVSGIDTALIDYTNGGTFGDFEAALKSSLKTAVMNSLMDTTYTKQLSLMMNEMMSATSEGGQEITAQEWANYMERAKAYGDEFQRLFQEIVGGMDDAANGMSEFDQLIESLTESVSKSLTDSLGEAAMDADWASFKKTFASELKKAVVQAAVMNAGLAETVKGIVSDILADGTISQDEIDSSIAQLKGEFNGLEGSLAGVQQILDGLTDTTIETNTSGTIIQQLSGADRDFLGEQIVAAMAKVQQNLDFTGAAIQTIQATQLIINAVHLHHEGDIIIQGTSDTDLKQVLGELITQALGAA